MEIRPTMLTYINEERACCESIIEERRKNLKSYINYLKDAKDIKRVIFLATGSSANAVNCCRYYFSNMLGVEVDVKNPFIYTYYENNIDNNALYIGVSQSGSSYSTIEATKKTKKIGAKQFVLTSNLKSAISKECDELIDIGCGQEKVGFVTKGFSSTVVTILLMAIEGAYALGKISLDTCLNEIEELRNTVSKIDDTIMKSMEWFDRNEAEFKKAERVISIGYGPGFGIAQESNTKLTETVRIPCTGNELEEYMHGPYIELNNNHFMFYIESKGILEDRLNLLKDYTSRFTNHIFTITYKEAKNPKDISIDCDCKEDFSALLLVIPFQVLSYRLAVSRGIDLAVSKFPDFDSVLKSKI